jgi:hypothetical protein
MPGVGLSRLRMFGDCTLSVTLPTDRQRLVALSGLPSKDLAGVPSASPLQATTGLLWPDNVILTSGTAGVGHGLSEALDLTTPIVHCRHMGVEKSRRVGH